jgi:membrane protein implicated in regulation of membrane protease activity
MSFLFGLSYWGWLIIGLVLLGLELVASFSFFLWLGASALVTALVLFVLPDTGWEAQFLIFSVRSTQPEPSGTAVYWQGVYPE